MKTTHLSAAAFVTSLTVLLAAHPARADEPAQPCADGATGEACAPTPPQAIFFNSTAPVPVIAEAACSLHSVLTIDGQPRRMDVQVDGRRCSAFPAPEGAIPLNVRITTDGAQQRVVVEAAAPRGVEADVIRSVVTALGYELRSRVQRVTAPPAPPPEPTAPPPASSPAPHTFSSSYGLWDRPTLKTYSPKMVGWGVATIVVGGLMMFGGTFGAMTSSGYDHSGQVTGLSVTLVGAGIAGIGVPLVVVGSRKVPTVTASVSPTGGSLRVVF